jgi:triphosphoribosyl-dephospho-CoA synthase
VPGDPAALLDARDERAALLAELTRRGSARGGPAVVWITVSVPGPDKQPPGIDAVFGAAAAALERFPAAEVALQGRDVLGPYAALFASGSPVELKRAAIALEEAAPARRLIDIDVYDHEGRQVDRARLGLSQRTCLICGEPARECIAAGRHDVGSLVYAAHALLESFSPAALARRLVAGAETELDLTPKPGLVDRHDNGSHPDLSYALMRRSIELLPVYFEDLLALRRSEADLGACIDAGRRAERRMGHALGANAHRGYIFLCGLLLLAACDAEQAARRTETPLGPVAPSPAASAAGWGFEGLRHHVRSLAREFFDQHAAHEGPVPSHGSRVRRQLGIGGIRAEARDGLPSVFDEGFPAYEDALARTGDAQLAAFALLGALMQCVEDTTTLHRCGPIGLARLRRDGRTLADLVASGTDPVPHLEAWNREYLRLGLTMGGVADCMALVFALHEHGAAMVSAGAL